MNEEEEPSVLESIEEESKNMEEEKPAKKPTREKNPNRVKAGHKLAAIGQKAKEDKKIR